MSDRICIKSKGKKIVHLSAEHVNDCISGGCNGGYTQLAFEFFRTNGVVTGGNYGSNEGCQAYQFPNCGHHVEKQ